MTDLFRQLIGGFEILLTGGAMFFPLLFFSIVAMALFLDKRAELKRQRKVPAEYIARIYRLLENERYDIAASLCENRPMLVTDLLLTGIQNRRLGERELNKLLKQRLRLLRQQTQTNLPLLGMVATAAPILGLLGTTLGMIVSFAALTEGQGGDAQKMGVVADGIKVALLTTFGGLVVAAPTFIAHRYLVVLADQVIREVQRYGTGLSLFLKAEDLYNMQRLDQSGMDIDMDATEIDEPNDAAQGVYDRGERNTPTVIGKKA
ncbi:MAG: MotA/TolQ/ExbB proton channel family protein [Candidatus Poribacteria bacterium]|nr:MotA/TolQ/ExbB proton channel family protein [Candidatus Poribacteria bacterium]